MNKQIGIAIIGYGNIGKGVHRLNQKGDYGAKTILDIAPALISPHSKKELLKDFM